MKILIFNDYAYIEGGAGKIAIESALALSEMGHDIVFFSAVSPVSESLKNNARVKVICLELKDILNNNSKLNAIFSGISNKKAAVELGMLLKEWKPDIAHIHGVSKALSWGILSILYSKKIPSIATLHDFSLICPNMGIYDFRKNRQCNYYKRGKYFNCLFTNCDKRSYAQKIWRWLRFRYTTDIIKVLRKLSGVIFVSNFSFEIYKDFIYPGLKYSIINNPVFSANKDFDRALSSLSLGEVASLREKCNRFLYVGRLSAEKGIDIMLEAFKNIESGLTVIGDGEMLPECIKAAKDSNGRIRVLGYQEQETISREMIESIALLLPSKVMETSGLVVFTAASLMLPSIVSDIGAPAEFLTDGRDGYFFKAGDSDSLKECIERIRKNILSSVEIGEKSREKFRKADRSLETYTKELEKFYHEVMA